MGEQPRRLVTSGVRSVAEAEAGPAQAPLGEDQPVAQRARLDGKRIAGVPQDVSSRAMRRT
jgi:hypothetical protein